MTSVMHCMLSSASFAGIDRDTILTLKSEYTQQRSSQHCELCVAVSHSSRCVPDSLLFIPWKQELLNEDQDQGERQYSGALRLNGSLLVPDLAECLDSMVK